MNYIGSKQKLSNFIKQSVYSVAGENLSDKIFCDLFAGTGIVGRNFKTEVKQIISNDIEYYSFVLNKNSLSVNVSKKAIKSTFSFDVNAIVFFNSRDKIGFLVFKFK